MMREKHITHNVSLNYLATFYKSKYIKYEICQPFSHRTKYHVQYV